MHALDSFPFIVQFCGWCGCVRYEFGWGDEETD